MNSKSCVIDYEWLEKSVILDHALVDVIEHAFITLANHECVIPSIQQIPISNVEGQVCVKSAYVPQFPSFVVKIAGNFPNNGSIGERNTQGCMCLFDSIAGKLDTVLVDNGMLTQLRTAAAGAVASKYLAPESVKKVAVIGAGVQARLQLQGLALVREFDHVSIYSRTPEKSKDLAQWVQRNLKKSSAASLDIIDAVSDAEVILTATRSTDAVLYASYLGKHKPIHITAMGSDAPNKNELSPDIYSLADRYVCDLISQSLQLGELRTVKAAGNDDFTKVEEIAELCTQQKYRQRKDRITVCDLTGVGILDLAIAVYARNMFNRSEK